MTKAQLRDEGYAEIKTTDDQENGYDKLTSNAQLSSADQQHGYFVLEQNSEQSCWCGHVIIIIFNI